MTTPRALSLSLLLTTLLGSATADDGLTRDQVKSALAEARRTGSISSDGEFGLPLNEMFPRIYSAHAGSPPKSRAAVLAELTEARRTGDIVGGESGLRLNEYSPWRYPALPQLAGKNRAQVRAELAEARVLGDLQFGEAGQTPAQTDPGRYAAVRAQRATQAQQLAAGRVTGDALAR